MTLTTWYYHGIELCLGSINWCLQSNVSELRHVYCTIRRIDVKTMSFITKKLKEHVSANRVVRHTRIRLKIFHSRLPIHDIASRHTNRPVSSRITILNHSKSVESLTIRRRCVVLIPVLLGHTRDEVKR